MADDKRTKIGPTGPVRPITGASAVAASTPVAATTPPGPSTSYLPPNTDPLLGQTLADRYVIVRKLGEGGMGAVYLATHNVLEKQVALKILHGEFARKADLVERFMQEAKAASRIRHENVIDISDFGTTPDGLVFFAMELLSGHDLHEEIARARLAGQLLPWERSKKIFLQICAALSAAHAHGIIHRDLKPENVYLVDFLGEPDFVKLLDFGIAKLTEVEGSDRKLTRTGMLFGTPEYMSPEQAKGEAVDARVDVYAMGCILFQLVTGRVPFEADNFMGVLSLHLTEPPPVIPVEIFDRIRAPRGLAAIIDKALAKDRNDRWATIDELARAVRVASGDKLTGPVAAVPSVAAPRETPGAGVRSRPATGPGRVKTQWTGNLSVPAVDEPAARAGHARLPLYIGAGVLLAGAAAVAVYLGTRHGGDAGGAGSGSGTAGSVTPPPPPVIDAAVVAADPPPPPPLTFEWSVIKLDSVPRGAEVKDLATDKVLGKTPIGFKLKPSRTAHQFQLHLKAYADKVIDILPDKDKIDQTETLDKGSAIRVVPPTAIDAGTAIVHPDVVDAGTPMVAKPDAATQVTVPDDDCGDPPCLKADPSRRDGGAAPSP